MIYTIGLLMGFTVWLKNTGDQTTNSFCAELK